MSQGRVFPRTKATSEATGKRRPEDDPAVSDGIEFPPHMRLSVDEAATAARLVRLMRHRKYWLRYFVEWVLREEAASGNDMLTVEQVEGYLSDMKNLHNWKNWLSGALAKNPAFASHPAIAWLDGDPSDDGEEDDIADLNRMYSLPAPDPTPHKPVSTRAGGRR